MVKPHVLSAGLSLTVILFFASFLALSPRNLHDLLVYQQAAADWQNHAAVYQRFLTTSDPTGGDFAYPPLFLIVFYPFTKLSSFYIVLAWDFLNLIFLFLSVTLLVKLFFPEKKGFFALKTFSLLLFSYPVLFTFQLGQTSLWALFAMSLSLFFIRKKKDFLSSVPLLVASFIKFFPAVLLLPFMTAQKKKFWSLFIICFLFLSAATWFLFPEETRTFVFQVLPRRAAPNSFPANQSVDAFLVRAFYGAGKIPPLVAAPGMASIFSVLLKLCGGMFFLCFVLLKNIAHTEKLVLTLLTFLLLSPIVWVHYYVLLLPVVLWFICHRQGFSRIQNAAVKGCFFIFYFSFICFSSTWLPFPANIVLMSLPLYAVLMMYVIFAGCLLKRVFAVPSGLRKNSNL